MSSCRATNAKAKLAADLAAAKAEIERLGRVCASLRLQRDSSLNLAETNADLARGAFATVERMKPVVEAACAWHRAAGDDDDASIEKALDEACEAYEPTKGGGSKSAAVVVQGGHEGTGPAIWDLVIAELEEQSPKNPRSDEAMARRRRIADDARARDAFGSAKYGRRLRARDGRDALIDSYQEDLDSLVYKRKAVEEGRACQGLYQRALEQVIATKAQIEADARAQMQLPATKGASK